jgi:hypothetical protein
VKNLRRYNCINPEQLAKGTMPEKNGIENCMHPVPPNQFGAFAMHCKDNQPFDAETVDKLLSGPLIAMQGKLAVELARTDE